MHMTAHHVLLSDGLIAQLAMYLVIQKIRTAAQLGVQIVITMDGEVINQYSTD